MTMSFLIEKMRKTIIFIRFLSGYSIFCKKAEYFSSDEKFGFYILPGNREIWSLPLVNLVPFALQMACP
jgi:hypothetical protein